MMTVSHYITDLYKKIFKKPSQNTWNPATSWTPEERAFFVEWCFTVVKEGHLKRIMEQLVEKSEIDQLSIPSCRPITTTPAEFQVHFRRGIGDLWEQIRRFANESKKADKPFDQYSVI